MNSEPLVLDIITGPNTLDQIQQTLDLLWDRHPEASRTARIHMDLAACEIGANILKYADDGRPVRMRMEAEVCGPDVRVRFTDDGRPAPIDLESVGMPSVMAEQGRGLALALAVLDRLAFDRDSTGNRWTLVRRLTD